MVIEGEVVNLGDEIVAASGADLWSGNLQNTIGYNEFGNPFGSGLDAWAGSFGDGTDSGVSCSGWTSTGGSGTTGNADASGTTWLDSWCPKGEVNASLRAFAQPWEKYVLKCQQC